MGKQLTACDYCIILQSVTEERKEGGRKGRKKKRKRKGRKEKKRNHQDEIDLVSKLSRDKRPVIFGIFCVRFV